VGGGTVRYSGTSWRFREADFKKLSTYGAVAGSSLADWPLTYAELVLPADARQSIRRIAEQPAA
jgi:hypothetical protein